MPSEENQTQIIPTKDEPANEASLSDKTTEDTSPVADLVVKKEIPAEQATLPDPQPEFISDDLPPPEIADDSATDDVPPESEPETPEEIPLPESAPPEPSFAPSTELRRAGQQTHTNNTSSFIQNLLIKARAKIQERKQKKLDKIMAMFNAKPKITNKDIQKLLRISSATSTRYLDILEKQNKIKQIGSTGKAVFYTKIQ